MSLTPADELAVARDALAFLERSRGRILEELDSINADIAEARDRLADAEAKALCDGDYFDWLRGNQDDDGPVVIQS